MTKPHQADITKFITSLMEGTDSIEERRAILNDLDDSSELARSTYVHNAAAEELAAISQEIGDEPSVTMAQPKKKSTRKTKVAEG